MAVTYSWEKRLDEALHQYELVLETDPGHLAAASGRARMLHWQGDVDAAARSYRQVLAIAPGHIEARLGLAATEVESLNLTDARDHYQEVLTAAPENPDAREGLRRLDEITRTRLAGRIGVALLDDTRAVTGHATVSYQWTRRWTVFGEYGVQAFSPGDAFAATPDVIVHRASAGAALRLDNKWTLAAAPTVQAADGQWHLGLAATAAFTPVEPLTLMVSARPGWTLDGRGDLLSWIGGEWRISPRWSASVQYFHYDDFASQRADAGVAKLAVQVLAPWRTEAGGGVEWRAGRPAWTAWSENRFAVARTVDLVFRYGFYHGVFDRHEMEAGVAVRF